MSSEEKKGEERQACDGFIPTAPHTLPFMLNNVSQRHWPTPFNSRPILSGALFFLYEEEKRPQINHQNLSVQTSVGRIWQGESVNMIASVIKKRRRGGGEKKAQLKWLEEGVSPVCNVFATRLQREEPTDDWQYYCVYCSLQLWRYFRPHCYCCRISSDIVVITLDVSIFHYQRANFTCFAGLNPYNCITPRNWPIIDWYFTDNQLIYMISMINTNIYWIFKELQSTTLLQNFVLIKKSVCK